MSARWRLADTGFTPEKPGSPRRMSIFTAAEVSSCARATSSRSVRGRSARQRSFPSRVAAQSARRASTWGSSRVAIDFSNSSLIYKTPGSLVTFHFGGSRTAVHVLLSHKSLRLTSPGPRSLYFCPLPPAELHIRPPCHHGGRAGVCYLTRSQPSWSRSSTALTLLQYQPGPLIAEGPPQKGKAKECLHEQGT